MPTLNVTKTYADNEILVSNDIDNIIDSLESFVNNVKLDDQNIQDNSITTVNIADGAITAATIEAEAITTAKILDGAVTLNKIADQAITAALIGDGELTEAKIEDETFTRDQLANSYYITTSSDCGTFNVTTSWSDVTNLSITGPGGFASTLYMLEPTAAESGFEIIWPDPGPTVPMQDEYFIKIRLYNSTTATVLMETTYAQTLNAKDNLDVPNVYRRDCMLGVIYATAADTNNVLKIQAIRSSNIHSGGGYPTYKIKNLKLKSVSI